jgi:hypothetical protein
MREHGLLGGRGDGDEQKVSKEKLK